MRCKKCEDYVAHLQRFFLFFLFLHLSSMKENDTAPELHIVYFICPHIMWPWWATEVGLISNFKANTSGLTLNYFKHKLSLLPWVHLSLATGHLCISCVLMCHSKFPVTKFAWVNEFTPPPHTHTHRNVKYFQLPPNFSWSITDSLQVIINVSVAFMKL